MMWRSSHDVLATIHEAHQRLKNHETDAVTAHAEARLLGAATRVLAINLEHARLTGRLQEGNADLPVVTFGEGTLELEGETGRRPMLAGQHNDERPHA